MIQKENQAKGIKEIGEGSTCFTKQISKLIAVSIDLNIKAIVVTCCRNCQTHIHTNTYTQPHTNKHIHTHTHINTHTRTHVHTHTFIHTHASTCMVCYRYVTAFLLRSKSQNWLLLVQICDLNIVAIVVTCCRNC